MDGLAAMWVNSNGIINNDFGENGIFYYDNFLVPPYIQTILQNGDKYFVGQGNEIIILNNDGILHNNFSFTSEDTMVFIFDMKFQDLNKIILGGCSNLNIGYCDFTLVRLNLDSDISVTPTKTSSSLLIYPNPTNDKITITTIDNLPIDNLQFEIYDLTGRVVSQLSNAKLSNSQLIIDVSHLQAGVYFVKFILQGTNQVQKFVKE